ncbi:winged helix-turn-helix domain-containing protein [Vibrio ziniensis]|uniref:Transcriptional regulator n=1 Tax=Vibrio ziniensis TaxID=2711221 RepID=A0A6G7CM57_9VIBR|nr:transcriptional regulator [Vibrio ziniensis]QIH43164.1 transcriptional regulator [Vibrio ziniensis]
MTGIGTKFLLANRFTFDSLSNSLVDNFFDDELVRLGSNESRILQLFCQHPNEVVTRNELYDFVWREQGFEVDDSSLTQAISTLRKQLKDPTKSPEFIKTVPKRGYQLISSVAILADVEEKTDQDVGAASELIEMTSHLPEIHSAQTINEEMLVLESTEPQVKQTKQRPTNKTPSDIFTRLLILLSILLPVLAMLLSTPNQSEFKKLAHYHGVTVETPKSHPDLVDWLPSIEMCINKYISKNQSDVFLEKVIATGGNNDVLVLNYIHKPEYSSANITLKIVADQDQINKVCQQGASS